MDYREAMAAFTPLEIEDVPTFGSLRESERAVYGYNRMLEQFKNGHDDIAKIALEKIAGDFPLFVEAKHMYALSLAADNRFGKAEKLLREMLLLDLTAEETDLVERQLADVHKASRRQAADKKRANANNDRLLPVRAHMATASILQQAGSDRHVGMASEKEVEDVMRRIERGETDDNVDVQPYHSAVKSKAGPILFLLAMIGLILAAVFMLFVRPALLKQKNNERKLFWLEQQMVNRSNSDDVSALRQAYQQFLLTLD